MSYLTIAGFMAGEELLLPKELLWLDFLRLAFLVSPGVRGSAVGVPLSRLRRMLENVSCW